MVFEMFFWFLNYIMSHAYNMYAYIEQQTYGGWIAGLKLEFL